MQLIGERMTETIVARIRRGVNAADQSAKPLKPTTKARKDGTPYASQSYAVQKQRKGLPGIRNWVLTGATLSSAGVLNASENTVTIGFRNMKADIIAHVNNRRELAFAVSPADRQVFEAAVREAGQGFIRVE